MSQLAHYHSWMNIKHQFDPPVWSQTNTFPLFTRIAWRNSRLFNKGPAWLKLFFRSDLHWFSTHFKPMDCRYLPATKLSLNFLSNCCRWSRKLPIFVISFFNFQQPSLKKNNYFLNVVMQFCFFHSLFYFAHNFIMILLYSKSINYRMKTVLNDAKVLKIILLLFPLNLHMS